MKVRQAVGVAWSGVVAVAVKIEVNNRIESYLGHGIDRRIDERTYFL